MGPTTVPSADRTHQRLTQTDSASAALGADMGRANQKAKKPKGGAVITFDESARKQFLTGFRKRKNERRQHARQKIAEQVRNEKIEERKERRQATKATRRAGPAGPRP